MKDCSTKNSLVKFDLIENAKDSLTHAIAHLTSEDGITKSDLKRAIMDVAHVVELILKERLKRIHGAFIWEDIDKYPSAEAQTVGTDKAVERLLKLGNIVLSEESRKTIKACRRWRNLIEHYEFEIENKEAKAIIGRMLSFIFDFAKQHLRVDLEEDFKKDDQWKTLIEFHEFWEAHANTLTKQFHEQGKPVCECPSCGAATFNLLKMICALCGHGEEQVECDFCKQLVWESESRIQKGIDGDESGAGGYSCVVCNSCWERQLLL